MTSEAGNSGGPAWLRVALIGRRPKFTLIRIVVLVAVCFVVFKFILLPIRVEGASMLPTYRDRGINFVNRLAYRWHGPRRGDVVSIRLAGNHVMFMKRIIALPGETVAFVHGHAVINDQVLAEPYVKFPCHWEHEPVTLGPDDFYCVGDNRSMPWENHTFGIATRGRIVGKVLL